MTLSLIIPVYNHADALVRTLQAIARQTRPPDEVIVVDDGSTDAPEAAVTAAGVRLLVTRWLALDTNQGAPVARNTGFAASTGQSVLFLDADAALRPDALALLSEALNTHPEAAFAYSAFRFGRKTFASRPFAAEALAEGNFIHTSALIRRDAFPGFDPSLRRFQDWDLWIRIAQAGGAGVFVPEALLAIEERKTGGMSRWIPAFAYRLPWRSLGWTPMAVERYRTAERVIRTKHAAWFAEMGKRSLAQAPTVSTARWFGMGVFLALGSALAIGTPANGFAACLFAAAVLALAAWRPPFALAVLAFELVVGSKGGWVKLGSDAVNDGGIGIRILLFTAFFVGWGISLFRTKSWGSVPALGRARWVYPYAALAAVVGWGAVRGGSLGNASAFLVADANAWGFLALLVPAAVLARQDSGSLWRELRPALRAGLGALTVLTLILFILFSRAIPFPADALEAVYRWVRQSGLGEITKTAYRVSRIFLQSQFFLLPAWLWLLIQGAVDRRPLSWRAWVAWIVVGAAILASFSRSFWLALAVAAGTVVAAILWETRKALDLWIFRRVFGRPLIALVGSLALLFSIASFAVTGVIGGRFLTTEPAAASRWSLLPIMWSGIRAHPLLGSGFGATLTYPTSDPRLVEQGKGLYTTFAFEWGWLDLWYKLGVMGVIVPVLVLGSLVVRARALDLAARLFVWGSALLLAVTHVFTPYLNHPLGIGLLIFLEVFLQNEKRLGRGAEAGVSGPA